MIYSIPYAIVAAGLALSWRFNRGRVFFVLMSLAVSYWAMSGHLPFRAPMVVPQLSKQFLLAVLGIFLPLNILVFSLLKERGIFTRPGFLRAIFLLAQVGLAYWAWNSLDQRTLAALSIKFWPTHWMLQTNITHIGIVLFGAAFLVLIYRSVTKGSALDGGTLGTLIAVAYMLHSWNADTLVWLLAAAAGILLIALVQDSYKKAYVDELTNLPGRRSLEEYFLKLGGDYTVGMVDIDHFKKCNDRYGHDVGDQVLRMIATHLRKVGSGGKAFRYGGEEFTVVFPGKLSGEAFPPLEALRASIEANRFVVRSPMRTPDRPESPPQRTDQRKLGITVSIGFADSDEGGRPYDVIKAADKALYQAKNGGRNRVRGN
jgi:diguanylate cyclase (GGDEF)-like protein